MKKEQTIAAIKDGTVIDHIPADVTFKVIRILDLRGVDGTIAAVTNLKSKKIGFKGIVKIGKKYLTRDEVNKIAVIAPNASVNIIKNYAIKSKMQVALPKEIVKIVRCANPSCITNHEAVETRFLVHNEDPLKISCHYCERSMNPEDIILL